MRECDSWCMLVYRSSRDSWKSVTERINTIQSACADQAEGLGESRFVFSDHRSVTVEPGRCQAGTVTGHCKARPGDRQEASGGSGGEDRGL